MKALRLIDWKREPELVEVSKPTPAPGEVVIKIGGAGACHSDLHLMHDFEAGIMPWQMPFTLGHENAGWVDSIGSGVTTVSEGDAVAVYGAWGCGKCSRCQQGFAELLREPGRGTGFQRRIELARAAARPLGDATIVGIAGGTVQLSFFSQPYEVSIQTTYWGPVSSWSSCSVWRPGTWCTPSRRRTRWTTQPRRIATCTRGRFTAAPWLCPEMERGPH